MADPQGVVPTVQPESKEEEHRHYEREDHRSAIAQQAPHLETHDCRAETAHRRGFAFKRFGESRLGNHRYTSTGPFSVALVSARKASSRPRDVISRSWADVSFSSSRVTESASPE